MKEVIHHSVMSQIDSEGEFIIHPITGQRVNKSDVEGQWVKFRSATPVKTHSPDQCSGQHCCIHNPSDHHMKDWPQVWRDDKGVMERTCPHGIGHPDPDDVAHLKRIGEDFLIIHGCDGCCTPPAK